MERRQQCRLHRGIDRMGQADDSADHAIRIGRGQHTFLPNGQRKPLERHAGGIANVTIGMRE